MGDAERALAESQALLTQRLAGLTKEDFEGNVHFLCTANLTPPPALQGIWSHVDDLGVKSAPWLASLDALLVVANPLDQWDREKLNWLMQFVDLCGGEDGPPIFLVPQAAPSKVSATGMAWTSARMDYVMSLGLDGIVIGEPEGLYFSLSVNSQVAKAQHAAARIVDDFNRRQQRREHVERLRGAIDWTLWDYARSRIARFLPPVDSRLPAGLPREVHGFTVGKILGAGSFGTVYMLTATDRPGESEKCQVLKVTAKQKVCGLQALKAIDTQIKIMRLLSSATHQHPHVLKFYEVYHSPTHLLLRVEYSGPENLFHRLKARCLPNEARPLSQERCVPLIVQAVDAVTHMHLGPHVCHRDIKPENFTVFDQPPADLHLKIVDFDMASMQTDAVHAPCYGACGTVPFSAPEVSMSRFYDGMAADIWSLAVVMLEIFCGLRVLDKALCLDKIPRSQDPGLWSVMAIQKVAFAFQQQGAVQQLLSRACLQELKALVEEATCILESMLVVDPAHRLTATELVQHMRELPFH